MVDKHNSLAVCIVMYNTTLEKSPSFKSLYEQMSSHQIFVFDNSSLSDIVDRNVELSSKYKINYQKTNNVGLGNTYNFAISMMKSHYEYIGFFDQDTIIPTDYITVVNHHVHNNEDNSDVFVPQVVANGTTISPILETKTMHSERVSVIKTAINSGMFVRVTVFDVIQFDENLFLDYIDHDFFKKLNQNKKIATLLPLTLNQSFSDNEKNLDKALTRFSTYWLDTKIYCKVYGQVNYLHAFKHVLKLTLRYRSSVFLKKVIFNGKN